MTASAHLPSAPVYLAIDQGGHASRALIVDATGVILARGVREISPRRNNGAHIEYDAEALLASVRGAIADALDALGDRRDRLAGAALATQRSNVVCWDRHSGTALSPVISWQDRRDAAWLRELGDEREQVRRITGLPLSAHYGANKLRWCLKELPEVRRALREDRLAWGPMAGFLLFRLLRERPLLIDRVNAARTQLYDLAAGDWSPVMLEMFGLPRAPLPVVAPCRAAFGTLDCRGMPVPLTVVTGDQSAALFAAGPPAADVLHVTAGTGAFVLRVTGERAPASTTLLAGIVFDDGRSSTHVLEGTVNGAGSALDWLTRQAPACDLAGLPGWLETVSDPPLFLNGISGLGTPYMIADAPVAFVGAGDAAARAVAVCESIVFLLQRNIEAMAPGSGSGPESTSAPLSAIHIGGGLARLDGLCRRLADLSGLRVERGDETETTALGLAWLLRQADAIGKAPWHPADRAVTVFTPGEDAALHRRYRRWRDEMARALAALPGLDPGPYHCTDAPDQALRAADILVAHRGDAGRYPENTLPAIKSALRAGLNNIEIDIQLTADGIPVLLHDVTLKRTTGKTGRITQTTRAGLHGVSAGETSRFGARFGDVPIPTLESVIAHLGDWPAARLFVEIKQESLDAFGIIPVVARVMDTIAPQAGRCVVISYNADALHEASRRGAHDIGWVLTRYNDDARAVARRLAPEYLFCNYRKLPRAEVPLWRGPWRWVCYEIEQPALAARLHARGVDLIETMQIERFIDAG